ncbi:MAG: TonB-dependent receptor domain-containing protein [Candidatus Zixiibacteriota bacterium]
MILAITAFATDLTICIIDRDSGLMVQKANVTFDGILQKSNSEGCTKFSGIKPGIYQVYIDHPDYRSLRTELKIENEFSEKAFFDIKPLISTMKPIKVQGNYEMETGNIVIRNPNIAAGSIKSYIDVLPGVQIIENDGKSSVSIEGSRPEDVLMVLDGNIIPRDQNGISDISSIEPDDIESIEIRKSGIPAKYSSLAPAGIVLIETGHNSSPKVSSILGYGSYEKYSLRGDFDCQPFSSVNLGLNAFYNEKENDFPYSISRYPDSILCRKNNHSRRMGFGVASEYQSSCSNLRYVFSVDYFTEGMPGSVDIPTPFAEREGQEYRTGLSIDTELFSKTYFNSNITYNSSISEIYSPRPYVYIPVDSRQKMDVLDFAFSIDREFMDFLKPSIGFSSFYESFMLDNNLNPKHGIDKKNRQRYSPWIELNIEKSFWNRFDISLFTSIRQDYFSEPNNKLSKSVELESSYLLFDGEFKAYLGIAGGYNESFNLPAFNDLYWIRDAFAEGNPDLSPEIADRKHIKFHSSLKYGKWRLIMNTDFFDRQIDSVIVWNRGFDGLYRPINLAGEKTTGRSDYLSLRFGSTVDISYSNSLVDARQISDDSYMDGLFMPFRPDYMQKISLELRRHDIRLKLNYSDIGKRYMLPANTKWTEPYQLLDASLGYTFEISDFTIDTNIELNNIMDEKYEILKGYPMIGRNFYLNVKAIYRINKLN